MHRAVVVILLYIYNKVRIAHSMIINQEADEIAYRVAFACQRTSYIVVTKKAKVKLGKGMTKTRIVKALKARGKVLDEDYKLDTVIGYDPDYMVKRTLEMFISRLTRLIHPTLGKCTELNLFLSPSDGSNFRNTVPTIEGPNGLGYKKGRKERPKHLKYIRELMVNMYGAREVHGYEADDALSMYQESNTVASHVDKDIAMVPGEHYNWTTGEFYTVPGGLGQLVLSNKKKLKRGGLIFFYAQLLMGDRIDNIPGIKRCGDVTAYKLLKDTTNEQEAFDIVLEKYKLQYGEMYKAALLEVADLLWMVRADKLTGSQYIQYRELL